MSKTLVVCDFKCLHNEGGYCMREHLRIQSEEWEGHGLIDVPVCQDKYEKGG